MSKSSEGKMWCCWFLRREEGGQGVFCCLDAFHTGPHKEPDPVPRGRHQHPYGPTICYRCQRCGNNLGPSGSCYECSYVLGLGFKLKPEIKDYCLGCGVPFKDASP